MATATAIPVPRLISIDGLGDLFEALVADGYRVIGPAVQDGAIVLRELSSAAELPSGWGVRLEPGGYQLRRRDDTAAFGHTAGPNGHNRLRPVRAPGLTVLRGYRRAWLRGDLIAGVTVAAYLVPQVMAYAAVAVIRCAASRCGVGFRFQVTIISAPPSGDSPMCQRPPVERTIESPMASPRPRPIPARSRGGTCRTAAAVRPRQCRGRCLRR